MSRVPKKQPPVTPSPSGKDSDVTNLLEFEEQRELVRKRLRAWHLFLPATGDDVRAYKSLLGFVKPYRGKLLASILFAAVSALFLGIEITILQEGLTTIFAAPSVPDQKAAASGRGAAAPTGPVDPNGEATNPAAGVIDTPSKPPPAVVPDVEPREPSFIERTEHWIKTKREDARNWVYARFNIHPPKDPAKEALKTASGPPPLPVYSEEEKRFRKDLLWLLGGLLMASIMLASAAKYAQSVLMTGVSRRIVRDVRSHLFKHLMGLSVRFHQKNHSAQLVSRITNDLEVFGRFLTEAMVRFIQDLLEFLAMLIFVAFNQGSFIFVVAGVIGIAIAPVNQISRRLRKGDKASQAGMAEIAIVIQEAFVGQRVVKAFASEDREFARFRKVARQHMQSQMRVRRLRSLTEPIVMGIGGLGVATIILIGGYRVLDGGIASTSLIINVLALARAMAGLRGMSKQLNDFQLGLAAADRVGSVMQAKSEVSEKPDAPPLPPFSREIRFDNVHFRHEANKPTLHGIDLVIRKGEKVALVGPSGAGKTTFIDLVPRFFDVDVGSITIDGHDLRDVTLRSIREQIGIVSQETILFRDSIRDNIGYGRPDATDAEIIAAAKAANADDFILKKPRGYDTRIGERGLQLSGGERQRIAIARALLRDPPILILDEATSSLDSESESVVQAALQRLMVGRTVIVIAHRLSTIRDADRIVVLEHGKIAEIGAHDELMARPGSIYRRHHEIQTRAHRPDALAPPVP